MGALGAAASIRSDDVPQINALIDEFYSHPSTKLEQELFRQIQRLAQAERALQKKVTKKAARDRRIAKEKIERLLLRRHRQAAACR
jgi:hypothetical protein